MLCRTSALLSAALAAVAMPAAVPAPAASPVQRCVAGNGHTVYTDRGCAELGATERIPPPSRSGIAGAHVQRIGCARTLPALTGEVGAAVRAGDVNRLSSIYDWNGVSGTSAARILDQLEAMVARPLLDIAPIMASIPRAPDSPAPDAHTTEPAQGALTSATGTTHAAWPPSAETSAQGGDTAHPPAAPSLHPTGLRVEQTLAGSATPSRTVFNLRRHYGCLWISL